MGENVESMTRRRTRRRARRRARRRRRITSTVGPP